MGNETSVEGVDIGQRIRTIRKAIGLRQSDLAQLTGFPASHLSDIERGTLIPTIPTLYKISQALHRPLGYFLQEHTAERRSLGMLIHGTSIGGQAAAHFAQLVEHKTGGDVKLHIYHCARLGTAREQVRGLAEGAIHLYIDEPLSFEPYANLCAPVFLPFFFRDREQYHRFLRSDIFAQHIFRQLLEHGIRLLNPASNWECGSFELLFSTQPIFTPADLAGRRFRSYASAVAVALRRALAAEPVIVEWERIDEAFERGQIDTILVPAAYFSSLQLCKMARYATYLDYGYTLNLMVAVSEREYRHLSPDVQQVLAESVEETGLYCTQLSKEQIAVDLQVLPEKHGLAVIHPNQEVWRTRFGAAIRELWSREGLAPALLAELQAV